MTSDCEFSPAGAGPVIPSTGATLLSNKLNLSTANVERPVNQSQLLELCSEEIAADEEAFCDWGDDVEVLDKSIETITTLTAEQSSLDPFAGSKENTLQSEAVDFSKIPKMLDGLVEMHDKDGSICSTTVKTTESWTRRRQDNLLCKPKTQTLGPIDIKSEKNRAFDLLDALSRSGSLPIACSELHVIICLTHRFEKDVMGTVIEDNINPIEKLEMSTLLFASAIHGVPPQTLIRDAQESKRLANSFPELLLE